MTLFNVNNLIGINSIDTHIYNAIHDINNLIRKSEKDILINLYNQYKPIVLQGFVGKKLNDIHSVFWQSMLIHMMISLENMKISGLIKRDLIIETICIVIRNDLLLNDQDKVFLETQFRNIAYQIIDLFVFASKNINHPKKKKGGLFN